MATQGITDGGRNFTSNIWKKKRTRCSQILGMIWMSGCYQDLPLGFYEIFCQYVCQHAHERKRKAYQIPTRKTHEVISNHTETCKVLSISITIRRPNISPSKVRHSNLIQNMWMPLCWFWIYLRRCFWCVYANQYLPPPKHFQTLRYNNISSPPITRWWWNDVSASLMQVEKCLVFTASWNEVCCCLNQIICTLRIFSSFWWMYELSRCIWIQFSGYHQVRGQRSNMARFCQRACLLSRHDLSGSWPVD